MESSWAQLLIVIAVSFCAVSGEPLDRRGISSRREVANEVPIVQLTATAAAATAPAEYSSRTEAANIAEKSVEPLEIEAKGGVFRRRPFTAVSSRNGPDSTSTTTAMPTTTTEDISVLYSLYGAPAPGILLSEQETAAAHSAPVVAQPPVGSPAHLSQLASPLQSAINDFTYGGIQDAFEGLAKSLQRSPSQPRFLAQDYGVSDVGHSG